MATYPIVLAHGIARFDALTDSFFRHLDMPVWGASLVLGKGHYFKGIVPYLHHHGFVAFATSVGFADRVEVRAAQLAAQVQEILARTGAAKVHIIGHSMGGLDGRTMIVQEDMAEQVASMTSIGTPHLGTSFADFGLANGGHQAVAALRPYISMEGFLTLTIAARTHFNEAVLDEEATNDVYYQCYGSSQDPVNMLLLLRAPSKIIFDAEGVNDGLVPLSSQLWQPELVSSDGRVKPVAQHTFPFPADHLNQVGWWDLEEMAGKRWWQMNVLAERARFEERVRRLYVQIARDVTQLAD